MFYFFYILWAGLCWRLRGGLISEISSRLFGFTIGTGKTRVLTSALMTVPFVALNTKFIVLWPAIYIAMCIGYFDRSMGLTRPYHDHLMMASWGICVSLIMLSPFVYFNSIYVLSLSIIAILVPIAYEICKRFGGSWTERAEVITGMIYGIILSLAYNLDFTHFFIGK